MMWLREITELHDLKGPIHAAIGVFDGLHRGHQSVIASAVQAAREVNGVPLVVTFDPHPLAVVFPENAPKLICSTPYKIRILESLGVEHVLTLTFDNALSQWTGERFIEALLSAAPGIRGIHVGADWAFGKGRSGNVSLLTALGQRYGYQVFPIAPVMLGELPVSSTRLREAVSEGKLGLAMELLGRSYSVFGQVIEGRRLGRQLGFPTANIALAHEQLPPFGVYAVQVVHGSRRWSAVANLGVRPTVSTIAPEPSLEVHLLDFEEDLYGQWLEIEFCHYLRQEKRFENLDALTTQIHQDVEEARAVFNNDSDLRSRQRPS